MTPDEIIALAVALFEAAEKIRELIEKARDSGQLPPELHERVSAVLAKRSESGILVDRLEKLR